MGKRATKLDKQFRIAEFVRMLSRGYVNSQLVAYAEAEWGLKETMARQYITEAREVLIADVNQDRQVVVAELLAASRTVIQEALKKKLSSITPSGQ